MSEFLRSEFGSLFGAADRGQIQAKIDAGLISVDDCDIDGLFSRMAHLPATSRIQWDKVPNISLQLPSDQDGVVMKCKLELIRSIGGFYQLESERGYLFEDLFADCVLQMDFETFGRLEGNFFETAGHKYFLSISGDWLVNFTMEEQLYFSNRI